jgi:hypothetical protein
MSKNMLLEYPYIEEYGARLFKLLDRPEANVKEWSAFNPTIGYSDKDGYVCLIRSSNYVLEADTCQADVLTGGGIKTNIWLCTLDQATWEVCNLRKVKIVDGPEFTSGVEDCRLYLRGGEWYFHGVVREDSHTPVPRLASYKLDIETGEARFVEKYDSPTMDRTEKNWMTTFKSKNPNFDFIYGPTSIIKDGLFICKPNTDNDISQVRGGSSLLELDNGNYLAVTHTVYMRQYTVPHRNTYKMVQQRKYTHQFVKYDNSGAIVGISPEFVFDGNLIEFAAGLSETDTEFVVSYGIADSSAHIAVIPKDSVLGMLKPVDNL